MVDKTSYNFTFGDIVEKDEVTEHGDEAEKPKSSHNVDHRVLQVKFSWHSFEGNFHHQMHK